jgi:hypothetical protein
VVGDRRTPDRHDVGTPIQCALHVWPRAEVAGGSQANCSAAQAGEQLE